MPRQYGDRKPHEIAHAVRRAKLWAKHLNKNVAITDLSFIVRPDGVKRSMTEAERNRAKEVLHGEKFTHDGNTLAMSSYANMKWPKKDGSVQWPGTPPEGPGEKTSDPRAMEPRTGVLGEDAERLIAEDEGGLGDDFFDQDVDFGPGNLPEAEGENRQPSPPASPPGEGPPAPPPPRRPAELPEGSVVGSDNIAGPDPRVRELIKTGMTRDEAIKYLKQGPEKPGVDKPVEEKPKVTKDPENFKAERVAMDGLTLKWKHWIWLNEIVKRYPGVAMQQLIDNMVAQSYAQDHTRHGRGRGLVTPDSFSGSREGLKNWLKGEG